MKAKREKYIGLICTLLLAFGGLFLFLGSAPLLHPGTIAIGPAGDGLKDVFNTYYHARYDTTMWHSGSMNYPYGECVTYTGCQTYISIPIQLLRRAGIVDLSGQVLLFVNLLAFAAVIACALFLYLILYELAVPWWMAVFGAVFITFLSPQLSRMGSHITLGYAFILPCAIYLFMRWHQTRRWSFTAALALLTCFAALAHPYYVIFLGAIWLIIWGYFVFYEHGQGLGKTAAAFQCIVQFVVPIALVMLLTKIGDSATDRVPVPRGVDEWAGNLLGIFCPTKQAVLHKLATWEALAWIGIPALVLCVCGLVAFAKKIWQHRWRELLHVTDHLFLNLLFWTSVLLLLFSVGVPLRMLPATWLQHLGPLAQLRALGRFEWLFFYAINIILVYEVARWINEKQKLFSTLIATTMLVALAVEDCAFARFYKLYDVPAVPQRIFVDIDNQLTENQWVKKINPQDYQSILPLPFFSIGSEHLLYGAPDEDIESAFYVAAKTGLPMHAISASRSSISQTYKNLALTMEPYEAYDILEDLPDSRPILVVTTQNGWRRPSENRLLSYADTLLTAGNTVLYRLEISDLNAFRADVQKQMSQRIQACWDGTSEGLFLSDSTCAFQFETFDEKTCDRAFQGAGASACQPSKWVPLFDGHLNMHNDVWMSFAVADYQSMLMGHTDLQASVTSPDGNCHYWFCEQLPNCLEAFHDGWGIVRVKLTEITPDDHVCISIRNRSMPKKQKIHIDNLLFTEGDLDVVYVKDGKRTFNNHIF